MVCKWMLTLLLVLEAAADIKKREIHLTATIMIVFLGACRSVYLSGWPIHFQPALLPGIIVMLFSVISKGAIGMGDGIVLAGLGLWLSAEQILHITMTSLFLCGICACVCTVILKKSLKYEMPYLVFLLLGYICGGGFI